MARGNVLVLHVPQAELADPKLAVRNERVLCRVRCRVPCVDREVPKPDRLDLLGLDGRYDLGRRPGLGRLVRRRSPKDVPSEQVASGRLDCRPQAERVVVRVVVELFSWTAHERTAGVLRVVVWRRGVKGLLVVGLFRSQAQDQYAGQGRERQRGWKGGGGSLRRQRQPPHS